ncbi:MAG: hypothetical protein SNJ77_05355 [Cytophagales bacterium]
MKTANLGFFIVTSFLFAQNKQGQNINELTPPEIRYEIPQKTYQQKVYYGAKWGLGAIFPSETYGNIQTSNANYSTQIGGLVNFRVSDNFSFRHELNLSFEITNSSKKNSRPLLLEIPWLINFHFNEQSFMFGGLQTQMIFLKPNLPLNDVENLIRSDLDFAFAFGWGYIWEDSWHINFRIVHSFNRLVKIQNQDFNGAQVSLAYLFHKLSDEDKKLMRMRKKRLKRPVLETMR